jgi:hypothetical protein
VQGAILPAVRLGDTRVVRPGKKRITMPNNGTTGYQCKKNALERIAADWLDENGIAYRREEDSATTK